MRDTLKPLTDTFDEAPEVALPIPVPTERGESISSDELWAYVERRTKANEKAAEYRARQTPEQRAKRAEYMKRYKERKKQARELAS